MYIMLNNIRMELTPRSNVRYLVRPLLLFRLLAVRDVGGDHLGRSDWIDARRAK